MNTWQLQDARAHFSEVVASAVKDGPQIITKRGVKTAVVLPFAEWERFQSQKPSLLEALQSGPQFELRIPQRGKQLTRKPVSL